MVVCMSRRICIDLYRELVRLRPDWHDDDDGMGAMKVVMTGSASDPTGMAAAHQEQGTAGRTSPAIQRPRLTRFRSCWCGICG